MTTRCTVIRPGVSVRGSRSGRPIMAALDLLGRRWALRILWELRAGPLTFRAIRAALAGGPHIFNLGHGVMPPTPPEHVAELIEVVRQTDLEAAE